MRLLLVPPWTLPTVTTAISPGGVSRDTMVCSRTTIMAASTTGSMVCCGMAPWPPFPYTVTLMLSSVAMKGPERVADRPGDAGQHVLGQGNVGGRDALEQAVVDHALGAVAGLLGRLEERNQGSGPLATVIGHELGHAEQARHVHVVATGMGHRHLVAVGILAGRSARVVRAGILPDGQCVQFGPEQYGGSAAIGQDAHHSRTADASVDREVIFLQFPGDTLGGALLLVG